ncbi:hypothetical protein Y032_0076g1013 [Ancylostoma ceylanicum]|uniref:Uncharacterized protein n=1 Tax=Ancylostoma ceylanicum TaxID=53326 RepID=A0A016TUB5_9BILA|nr:hypothetical protein Y032_0076g1013 [Ancylostoma ceylanicum]
MPLKAPSHLRIVFEISASDESPATADQNGVGCGKPVNPSWLLHIARDCRVSAPSTALLATHETQFLFHRKWLRNSSE